MAHQGQTSELDYQGPPCFESLIQSIHDQVRPYITRRDKVRAVVGKIKRICTSPDTLHIQGDDHNQLMLDRKIKEYDSESENAATDLTYLIKLCELSSILPRRIHAAYYTSLDVLLVSPKHCLAYKVSGLPALDEHHRRNQHYVRETFLFMVTHSLVRWDFADTPHHRDLRRYFHQSGPCYDVAHHGTFSFENFPFMNQEAHERYHGLFDQIREMELDRLEEKVCSDVTKEIVNTLLDPDYISQSSTLPPTPLMLSRAKEQAKQTYLRHRQA